jgi:hypothetical protein
VERAPSSVGSQPHPHILNHLEKLSRSKHSSLFCLDIFSLSLTKPLMLLRVLPSLVGSWPHSHISNNLEKLSRSFSLAYFFFITDMATYAMERAPLCSRLLASPTYIKPFGKVF